MAESKNAKKDKTMKITAKKTKKNGFGILKGLTPFTAEDELTAHE